MPNTPPTPAEVEPLARQFCVEAGLDPDRQHACGDEITGPEFKMEWQKYRGVAHAYICMARAYDKLKAAK